MRLGCFIGVMFGISLDGIDVVLVIIIENMVVQQVSFIWFILYVIKEEIQVICQGQLLIFLQLGCLDICLGWLFVDVVLVLMCQESFKFIDVIVIGCYGQIVWYELQGEVLYIL